MIFRLRIEPAWQSVPAGIPDVPRNRIYILRLRDRNFLVLTRQNEYADSRRREVAARLDLNKAASRLQQALGQTLEAHGVALVP
ncbi:MAG: hypothetical protein FJW40_22440 [Acidobacteria bacterium]|nr:hypothetical protein [Acidobacteriota bacterium]